MKKKLFLRCLLGAPIGLAFNTVIAVLISVAVGDGNYYPVSPELISQYHNELQAVILQTVFSLLYGAAWGGASVIWEVESWGFLRQTIIHFVVCSFSAFPIAYFMYWMTHNLHGIVSYFALFLAIYCLVYFFLYLSTKKRLQQMNHKLKSENRKKNL